MNAPSDEYKDAHPISPSQIETFRLCQRKWAFGKLDNLPSKSNKFAQRGTDIHAALERWHRDNKPIDMSSEIGKIVAPGLRLLPPQGSHQTEQPFSFRTLSATYRGVKDMRGSVGAVRTVWDHKTTGNLRWMKTPERLRRDPQAVLYAVSEIVQAESTNENIAGVELNWVYYLTDASRPKARKVQLRVLPADAPEPSCPDDVNAELFGFMRYSELFDRFDEIEQTSSRILSYHRAFDDRQIKGGADVEYNVEGCDAFGGCPYKGSACVLTLGQYLRAQGAQEETKMQLSEKIREAAKKRREEGSSQAAPASESAAEAVKAIKSEKPKFEDAPATNPPESVNTNMSFDAVEKSSAHDADARSKYAYGLAQAIVQSRIYAPDDARSPSKIARYAVEISDALIKELAK